MYKHHNIFIFSKITNMWLENYEGNYLNKQQNNFGIITTGI